MRSLRGWAVLVAICGRAWAGGGPPAGYDDIGAGALDAHALADLYLQQKFGAPGPVQLRSFDTANGPAIGLLQLTLAHQPRRLGFRIDFGVGDRANGYLVQDPLAATHPDLAEWLSRIQQSFVTVVMPVGHGLQLDVGKFATPIGFEGNDSVSNWNYSRSLLFTFAEPTVHSGLRLSYDFGPVSASLFWINGWNTNFAGGNGLRSAAAAATWKSKKLEIGFAWAGGLERAPRRLFDPALTFRSVLDAHLSYSPRSWLTLVVAADWGHDRAQGGVDFGGVAVYGSITPTRWLRASLRAEIFDDPEGFTTGTAQLIGSVTETLEVHGEIRKVAIAIRLEGRQDLSSALVFLAPRRPDQETLTVALLVSR